MSGLSSHPAGAMPGPSPVFTNAEPLESTPRQKISGVRQTRGHDRSSCPPPRRHPELGGAVLRPPARDRERQGLPRHGRRGAQLPRLLRRHPHEHARLRHSRGQGGGRAPASHRRGAYLDPLPDPPAGRAGREDRQAVRDPGGQGLPGELGHRGERDRAAAGHRRARFEPGARAAQQLPRALVRSRRHHRQQRAGRAARSARSPSITCTARTASCRPSPACRTRSTPKPPSPTCGTCSPPPPRATWPASSPSPSRASAGSRCRRTACSPPTRRYSTSGASCSSPTRCRPAGAGPASTSGVSARTAWCRT